MVRAAAMDARISKRPICHCAVGNKNRDLEGRSQPAEERSNSLLSIPALIPVPAFPAT